MRNNSVRQLEIIILDKLLLIISNSFPRKKLMYEINLEGAASYFGGSGSLYMSETFLLWEGNAWIITAF